MKILAGLVLVLTLVLPSISYAQLIVGGDVGALVLFRGEESYRAPAAMLSAEWQVCMDNAAKNWLGVVGYYGITDKGGPGDLLGMGIRWYFRVAEGAAYPGLGLSGFFVGPTDTSDGKTMVARDTFLGGPEVLLELPWGTDEDKVLAWCGLYGHLFGDQVNALRFGLRASFN